MPRIELWAIKIDKATVRPEDAARVDYACKHVKKRLVDEPGRPWSKRWGFVEVVDVRALFCGGCRKNLARGHSVKRALFADEWEEARR